MCNEEITSLSGKCTVNDCYRCKNVICDERIVDYDDSKDDSGE